MEYTLVAFIVYACYDVDLEWARYEEQSFHYLYYSCVLVAFKATTFTTIFKCAHGPFSFLLCLCYYA